MEVVAAVAACTIVPMVYNSVRKRMHVKVNCWFCQHDQKVPYEQRNSFMCSSCEQYNGFNESGGYNRKVPGQHCFGAVTPARRYCKPAKSALARPDVVPQEGYGSNGLCDNCNRQQEIIMRKIADFEPLNEDRWSEELEMYRYKLNKAYPLCARCTFFTQNRLQEEKKKHADLVSMKNAVTNSIASGFTSVTRMASKVVRRRRQFFAGGFTVELLHAISFVVAVLLFVSQFNYLQVDAELDLIWFPPFLQRTLPLVLSVAYHLVGVLFCAHMIAIWSNKCRTTLPDLMLPVVAGLHLASFSFPDNMYRQDLALFRCAFACFETLLATAVTFVPRKKIPRNRPNRMLASAFSIASTPVSQCSSQATSCNNSMVLEKSTGGENRDKQQSSTPSLAIRQRNKWREREQTPEPTPASTRNRMGGDYEEMDWEPSLDKPRMSSPPSSSMRPSAVMARMIRETTPSRELAPVLSSLSLFSDDLPSKVNAFRGTPGRQSSQLGGSLSYAPSVAHTHFTARTASSHLPSIRSLRRDVSPSRSVFTSISQREEASKNRWLTPLLVAFAVASLLANVAMFYAVFKK